jgi:hypothetical protein
VSLSQKNLCAKKNSIGYAKKEKRRKRKNISMPKGMREKMHAKEQEEKKKEEERNKDSPYFQIRGTHPKRERFMIQKSTKKYIK